MNPTESPVRIRQDAKCPLPTSSSSLNLTSYFLLLTLKQTTLKDVQNLKPNRREKSSIFRNDYGMPGLRLNL